MKKQLLGTQIPLMAAVMTLLAVGSVLWFAHAGNGQQPKPEVRKPTLAYYGVSACTQCHERPDTKQPPLLCRCNEYPIWNERDKHGLAMENLKTDRAKRMGKLLGIADVAQDARCVNCHGVYPPDKARINKATFRANEGVTCCVCHGEYEEWVDLHGSRLKAEQWRALTRKEKEEVYGMRDLLDPVRRSQLCLSCHLGNAEEGKFITHAMYAAGHPPLPGIEIATFSEQMPRHWESWREKSKRLESLHTSLQERFGIAPEQVPFEKTQLVLVGGAATLRASLDLAIRQAEKTEKGDGLDLALFDCYACHHDLKDSGWRARRGYKGKPGRPPLQTTGELLVRTALISVNRPENELDTALQPLRYVFDSGPFGDLALIAARGKETRKWLATVIQQLSETKWDRSRMERVLTFLAEPKPNELPDYDTARIRAWAFLMIYAENRGLSYEDVMKQAESLNKTVDLALPSGRRESLEDIPAAALDRRNQFNPDAFNKEFRKLTRTMLTR